MTLFLWSLLAYAVLHVVAFIVNVRRDRFPRVIKVGLVALGAWAAHLLVA